MPGTAGRSGVRRPFQYWWDVLPGGSFSTLVSWYLQNLMSSSCSYVWNTLLFHGFLDSSSGFRLSTGAMRSTVPEKGLFLSSLSRWSYLSVFLPTEFSRYIMKISPISHTRTWQFHHGIPGLCTGYWTSRLLSPSCSSSSFFIRHFGNHHGYSGLR